MERSIYIAGTVCPHNNQPSSSSPSCLVQHASFAPLILALCCCPPRPRPLHIIQSVDIALAVLAVIGFERRMKDDLHGHHALLKLVLFKGHNLDRPDPSLHLPHSSFHARLHPHQACRLFQLRLGHPSIHDVLRNVHLLHPFHPTKRHDKATRTSTPLAKRPSTSSTLSTTCRISLLCSKPCHANHLGSDILTRRKTWDIRQASSLGTR